MKFLPIYILLSIAQLVTSQTRNLKFYFEKAKENNPLIHSVQNENKLLMLDIQQIKSVLLKPEINIEGSVLFAPIISHDNNSTRFQWVTEGATGYNGYDLALTDGGQYQGIISLKQPLPGGSRLRNYSTQNDVLKQLNDNKTELTIHELEQVVGYQYLLCLKARAQSVNSQLFLNQIDEQLGVMKKLVQNAVYKQSDLALLQLERSNYLTDYQYVNAEYKNNF